MTPTQFEDDLAKALETLKQCGIKQPVMGFRAPSFTIVERTMWALHILEKYNIRYDSSIFPMGLHPNYGVPNAPLVPYKITERLYEFPLSCIQICGINVPFSGGAYFRFFPYGYTRYCFERCNSLGRPVVFYIHPWELDPEQPKLKLSWFKHVRHYYNLNKTEKRLDALLKDFEFTTMKEALGL